MPIPERLNPSFGTAWPVASLPVDPLEEARKRLIVALDVPDAASAARLVGQLEGNCCWFKVGMELFTAAGPAVLGPLVRRGHSVFLDLKFHDIPNTVAGAVRSAARLGVRMVNVHAAGGPAMLAAARAALDGVEDPPELLAVTMLTSMSLEAGIRGFVCSAEEVATLRALTGPEGVLVIPGIRPAGSDIADQRRIATPAEALRLGASYLVVGRPITQAPDPAEAAEAILKEMAEAL
jgi:orotidine-5'-phosphate decarboxylase